MNKQNKFFIISFIPAIAYWYLEVNYTLQIALIGGLILSILEITLEKIFTKHVHKISKLNFILIAFLGGISLLGNDGIWFKLQPFFTGLALGGYFIYKKIKNESLMIEMSKEMGNDQMPEKMIKDMEFHMGLFVLVYGFFMAVIALTQETSIWLFWKTGGFYICMIVFFIIDILILKKRNYN